MIADSIKNLGKYAALIADYDRIAEYLAATDLSSLTGRRVDIPGTRAYVMPQEYVTKLPADAKWEAHRKYADIQYVLNGREYIGYYPIESAEPETPYSEDRDIAFYPSSEGATDINTAAGHFVMLFPQDVHRPCVAVGEQSAVKKIVIKFPVE